MTTKYSEYRSSIKSGDLLVWKVTSNKTISKITSTIIRLFTLSEYTHVGIAWYIGNRLFVIEACSAGIRLLPLSQCTSFYHIPMYVNWKAEYENALLSEIGTSYSYIDAIKGYLKILKPNGNNSWQCAELANYFYKVTGRDYEDNLTPSTLVSAVLNDGHSLTYVNMS